MPMTREEILTFRAGYYSLPFAPTHFRKKNGVRCRLIAPVENHSVLVEFEEPRRTSVLSNRYFFFHFQPRD